MLSGCQSAPKITTSVPDSYTKQVKVSPVEHLIVSDLYFDLDLHKEALGQCNNQLIAIKKLKDKAE